MSRGLDHHHYINEIKIGDHDMISGFSTSTFQEDKTFVVHDEEAVKRGLLRFLCTIKGEVPHHPNMGTRVPLLAFKPLDSITASMIREDIEAMVASDTRVSLVEMAIVPADNGFIVSVDLLYIPTNTPMTLTKKF